MRYLFIAMAFFFAISCSNAGGDSEKDALQEKMIEEINSVEEASEKIENEVQEISKEVDQINQELDQLLEEI